MLLCLPPSNGWPVEEEQHALHFMCTLSFCCSLFFLSLLFSRNHTECYSASVFLSLRESLHLFLPHTLHPWLHRIHPWGPIDRLQQPFNEISPLLLEKRNVVQLNDNSVPLFFLITLSFTHSIYTQSLSHSLCTVYGWYLSCTKSSIQRPRLC